MKREIKTCPTGLLLSETISGIAAENVVVVQKTLRYYCYQVVKVKNAFNYNTISFLHCQLLGLVDWLASMWLMNISV